jgi:septum formation protein
VSNGSLWRGPNRLILASQSKVRGDLLTNAGFAFDSIPADIDERAIQEASSLSSPAAIADLLSRQKALHVAALRAGHYVIGADQTLALGNRMFSKPVDLAEAANHLAALSGQTHHLHSAVAVAHGNEILFSHVAVAHITMRQLTREDIDSYLDVSGPAVMTSVGCYQLEKLGAHLIDRIEGDYFTILGLPLLPLLAFFRAHKLLAV